MMMTKMNQIMSPLVHMWQNKIPEGDPPTVDNGSSANMDEYQPDPGESDSNPEGYQPEVGKEHSAIMDIRYWPTRRTFKKIPQIYIRLPEDALLLENLVGNTKMEVSKQEVGLRKVDQKCCLIDVQVKP